MRVFTPHLSALALAAVVAAAAGCSRGTSPGSPPPVLPVEVPSLSMNRTLAAPARRDESTGFAGSDAGAKGAIVVSDAAANDVDVYTNSGTLIATMTGFSEPQGLGADPAGDVYVANTGASDILEYKSDYKTRAATLLDPDEYPADVAYSPASGIVGVTNILSTSGGAGSVSLYAKSKTKPCITVGNSAWSRVYFGAFDAANDFYVDGSGPNGNVLIGVVRGGCSATSITTLQSKMVFSFPGGIRISPADKLVVGDQNTPTLYTFDLPLKNVLGAPIAKTSLTGAHPTTFAFTASGKDLWTISSDAAKYAYPAGGSPLMTFALTRVQEPIDVLVLPAAQP